MRITYYQKAETPGKQIATFGVNIPQWHMTLNNLAVVSGKEGGFFICLPSFKNKETQEWQRTIEFDKEAHTSFVAAARKALEEYAMQQGITVE